MNETTLAHLLECFPDVDASRFDSVYYTMADEDTFMFVAVRGDMEYFEVHKKGHYSADTVDRKVFSIVNRFCGSHEYVNMGELVDEETEEASVVDMVGFEGFKFGVNFWTWFGLSLVVVVEMLAFWFVAMFVGTTFMMMGAAFVLIGLPIMLGVVMTRGTHYD